MVWQPTSGRTPEEGISREPDTTLPARSPRPASCFLPISPHLYLGGVHIISAMLMYRSLFAFATLVVLSLLAVGCGGSSEDTTTSVVVDGAASGVVFGRGSVPDAVPDSFPIPDEALVGATLVDANRELIEMVLTFPAAAASVAAYYDENLPARGYEITSSTGSDGHWVVEFNGDGVDGVIRIKVGTGGLSSATVQLTAS